MAYIRTCVQNVGAIRRPVRKTCLLSLIIDGKLHFASGHVSVLKIMIKIAISRGPH